MSTPQLASSSTPAPAGGAGTLDGWLPVMRLATTPPSWPGRLRRGLLATLVIAPLLVVGVGLWQAGRMAAAHRDRVVPGIVVDGRDLSGLEVGAARARLAADAAAWLHTPVELVVGDARRTVTPAEVGATADVDRAMERVQLAGSRLSVVDWVDIRWRGGDAGVVLEVPRSEPDPALVGQVVAALAAEVARPVQEAAMTWDEEALTVLPAQDGWALDTTAAQALVESALQHGPTAGAAGPTGPTEVVLPLLVTPAASATDDLGQVLFLDQSEHALQLWDEGVLVGQWTVATGARGFATPTGEYAVGEKRENPTWGNPAPDGWGRNMPAWIGPGPGNPLGVRAINWAGTDHIRFHGTADEASLGTDASHGCVRLSNDDVVELFDLVEVGARIISVA